MRISAVIPAYNAAGCVRVAVDSALAQTRPPDEIIVVDDGSKDATADVVSTYPSPVRLVRQQNAGPGAARNHGVRVSTGEWIAFLDADDSWVPTKLERQLERTGGDQVGIVHCRRATHWSVSRRLDFDALWERNPIVLSSALVRRRAFDDAGGFDENRELDGVEDYNLWLRVVARGWEVATCAEMLYRYTPAPGNLSSQTEKFARAELRNVEILRERLHLDVAKCDRKRTAILAEYGRELVYYRKMHSARPMLADAFRRRPTCSAAFWWALTFIPPALLDVRRRLPLARPQSV